MLWSAMRARSETMLCSRALAPDLVPFPRMALACSWLELWQETVWLRPLASREYPYSATQEEALPFEIENQERGNLLDCWSRRRLQPTVRAS